MEWISVNPNFSAILELKLLEHAINSKGIFLLFANSMVFSNNWVAIPFPAYSFSTVIVSSFMYKSTVVPLNSRLNKSHSFFLKINSLQIIFPPFANRSNPSSSVDPSSRRIIWFARTPTTWFVSKSTAFTEQPSINRFRNAVINSTLVVVSPRYRHIGSFWNSVYLYKSALVTVLYIPRQNLSLIHGQVLIGLLLEPRPIYPLTFRLTVDHTMYCSLRNKFDKLELSNKIKQWNVFENQNLNSKFNSFSLWRSLSLSDNWKPAGWENYCACPRKIVGIVLRCNVWRRWFRSDNILLLMNYEFIILQ